MRQLLNPATIADIGICSASGVARLGMVGARRSNSKIGRRRSGMDNEDWDHDFVRAVRAAVMAWAEHDANWLVTAIEQAEKGDGNG